MPASWKIWDCRQWKITEKEKEKEMNDRAEACRVSLGIHETFDEQYA